MAFSFNNGGGGLGRSRFRGRSGTLSEINVVPLVDVVLVLLIIFMLTAHVMEYGMEVDVPKVDLHKESTEDLPVVTLDRNGEVYLGEKLTNFNELGDSIKQRYPNSKAVFVRAGGQTVYDPIAQVISTLNKAKLDVRLVTQPVDERPAARK